MDTLEMDTLEITGLTVSTTIGVHAWEQRIKQRLLIDLFIPINCAHLEDNIDNALDYSQLCERVTQHVESTAFALIETVAGQVIQLIKTEFGVEQLKVRVSKPSAIKNAGNIAVTVEG